MLKHNKYIDNIKRVREPDINRINFLRLDKNERTYEFGTDFIEKIKSKLDSSLLSTYPELDSLYNSIATYNNISSDQMYISAGSEYAVKSVIETFLNPEDTLLIHKPSYALYSIYPKFYGSKIREVHYETNFKLDINKFIFNIDKTVSLVVLENPNGFIGNGYSLQEIESIAEKCLQYDIALVVDEAYYHLSDKTAADLIDKNRNIIVLRTFSKAFGLAGVRVGYIISSKENIDLIKKTMPMHEVNGFAAMVVKEALKNDHLMKNYVETIRKSKKILIEELSNINIETIDTKTNFILAKLPVYITRQNLLEANILVRRPFDENYLGGHTRITVGNEEQVHKIINVIKSLL